MRIFLFTVIIGLIGLNILMLLPEPIQKNAEVARSNLPIEQVNNNIRNVTPDDTMPGPKIEKTVISRLPAVIIPAPPARKEKPVVWRNLLVNAAGLLQGDGSIIHIQGIKPLALDATCKTDDGGHWPCGRFARTALRGLIRSHRIKCEVKGGAIKFAKCSAGTRDIGEWLVEQGWAKDNGGGYSDQMKTAKRQRTGMWRSERP